MLNNRLNTGIKLNDIKSQDLHDYVLVPQHIDYDAGTGLFPKVTVEFELRSKYSEPIKSASYSTSDYIRNYIC